MVQVWRVGCVFDGCSDFGPLSTYEINVNIVRDEKQKTLETKEGAKKKKSERKRKERNHGLKEEKIGLTTTN